MKRRWTVLTAAVLALFPSPAVLAMSNADIEFYSQNNIFWYSPTETSNSCFIGSGEGNTDYAGNKIFNDTQLSAIQMNQSFYENAQDLTGVPWQMIAVIHIRENGAVRSGPDNRQGPYQDYAKNPPAGLRHSDGDGWKTGQYTDEEFQTATNWAASFIKGKAGGKAGELLTNQDAVKYTFFGYNGRAKVYVDQAKALGFSDEEAANGEGSPYVMNRADDKRDPTVSANDNTWGQIKRDGGAIEYPANKDHGAYVMYASLAGVGLCFGGTTDPAAALVFIQKFIEDTNATYRKSFPMPSLPEFNVGQGTPGDREPHSQGNCWKAYDCGECTALSGWFVMQMTEYTYNGGNGIQVVGQLMAHKDNINKGLTSGTEPRPLSVFSETSGSDAGHTGVVLGVLDDGQIVTIENNWGHHQLVIKKRSVSASMTFAYVGDKMKAGV